MRRAPIVVVFLALVGVAGCSVPGPGDAPDGIHDPYESQNRRQHERTKRFDRALLRPASIGYVETVPAGVRDNVGNLADTASLPGTVVNQVLQGRLGDATRNTLRFAINATLGLGGLADVATDLGLPEDDSDFGETLYVWGLPEGAYLEAPLIGPLTERDAAGEIVDLALNPLGSLVGVGVRRTALVARVADELDERGRFADTYDSLLYESADSYVQTRIIYLQNRRFELGDTQSGGAAATDLDALDTEGFR